MGVRDNALNAYIHVTEQLASIFIDANQHFVQISYQGVPRSLEDYGYRMCEQITRCAKE